jgi:transcriptional regulator with XRE-family HTH domain
MRKANRMTMEEVGNELGIAKSSYAGYESAERTPPPDKLVKLAEMFDTSTDYLLGLTDDPTTKKDTTNLADFLKRDGLHYGGTTLTEKEIAIFRDILGLITKEGNR